MSLRFSKGERVATIVSVLRSTFLYPNLAIWFRRDDEFHGDDFRLKLAATQQCKVFSTTDVRLRCWSDLLGSAANT